MGMAFWNSEDGKGRREGSWEDRDAWRAEAESCQLDSGSSVFPVKHLRISVAVIAFSTSHRGGVMAGWLFKKWSQLAWHIKPSVGQFVPSPASRATHTPV